MNAQYRNSSEIPAVRPGRSALYSLKHDIFIADFKATLAAAIFLEKKVPDNSSDVRTPCFFPGNFRRAAHPKRHYVVESTNEKTLLMFS
jgi:hypothetical protein